MIYVRNNFYKILKLGQHNTFSTKYNATYMNAQLYAKPKCKIFLSTNKITLLMYSSASNTSEFDVCSKNKKLQN